MIRESLSWAARFCKRIWVWDLGSTDGTWDILQSMANDRIHPARKEGLPYTSSLRGVIANEQRGEIEDSSWIYILDADEFLAGDPIPALTLAEKEGGALLGAWQANFFPTFQTLDDMACMGESAWTRQPLEERFHHYRVEWFEWRFVRLIPEIVWDTTGPYSAMRLADGSKPRRSHQRMVVRHYRNRSPAQTAKRFELRAAAQQGVVKRFRYEKTGDFSALARPPHHGCYWDSQAGELIVPSKEIFRARLRITMTRCRRKMERLFS